MYKKLALFALGGFLSFAISGCVVRTYPVVKERVDQELAEGNRGYLTGKPKAAEGESKKSTRKVQVFEIELHPIKVEAEPPAAEAEAAKPKAAVYVPSAAEEANQKTPSAASGIKSVVVKPPKSQTVVMKKYTVKKGDTLQEISRNFYGTTKRWKEIYEVNREVLKSPNSIYPGQVIEIPVEEVAGEK
ncbi:MAG: LysM peptidoglycan-binding domain-containing protein [Candidatus Omnitrophota bacterium]